MHSLDHRQNWLEHVSISWPFLLGVCTYVPVVCERERERVHVYVCMVPDFVILLFYTAISTTPLPPPIHNVMPCIFMNFYHIVRIKYIVVKHNSLSYSHFLFSILIDRNVGCWRHSKSAVTTKSIVFLLWIHWRILYECVCVWVLLCTCNMNGKE